MSDCGGHKRLPESAGGTGVTVVMLGHISHPLLLLFSFLKLKIDTSLIHFIPTAVSPPSRPPSNCPLHLLSAPILTPLHLSSEETRPLRNNN